jgi:hypothetical protein
LALALENGEQLGPLPCIELQRLGKDVDPVLKRSAGSHAAR